MCDLKDNALQKEERAKMEALLRRLYMDTNPGKPYGREGGDFTMGMSEVYEIAGKIASEMDRLTAVLETEPTDKEAVGDILVDIKLRVCEDMAYWIDNLKAPLERVIESVCNEDQS